MRRSWQLFTLCMFIWHTSAYQHYRAKIPNGYLMPHPCKANNRWHGVGHRIPQGGGPRNPFGEDFSAAGMKWTPELCAKDSDGDGFTNGQEMGDPQCIWKENETPTRTSSITHPGICTYQNGSVCAKDKTFINCEVRDVLKNCKPLQEPEVLNMTIRIPQTPVPANETTYMCIIVEAPSDRDYHMVADMPEIDNRNVMHHIVIYGCHRNVPMVESELNKVKTCDMGAGQKCNMIIGGWTLGFSGHCIDVPAGFRLGGKMGYKHIAVELHWNNPELVSHYKDSSGITIFYTPKLRPHDAGILLVGQQYLAIPPGQSRHREEGICPSECSRLVLTGPINIFGSLTHMHYLGHEMNIAINRNGTFHRYISNIDTFMYDSPIEQGYNPAIEVLPGDEIVTTCVYKSLSSTKTTYYGLATSDEMCFGFMSFYPATNMPLPFCVEWRHMSFCDRLIQGKYNGCYINDFLDTNDNITKAIIDMVRQHCDPDDNCPTQCQNLLNRLSQENPCLSGDVWDYIHVRAVNDNIAPLQELRATFDLCKPETTTAETATDVSRSHHLSALHLVWTSMVLAVQMIKD